MALTTAFILYLAVFRTAIIAAGIVSIALGYKLFCRGIWPGGTQRADGATDGTSLGGQIAAWKFDVRNAAPGTCFALFGAALIVAMLATGQPALTMDTLRRNAANQPSDNTRTDSTHLVMQGGDVDALTEATSRALEAERLGKHQEAVRAYGEATGRMATPINGLAWLYQALDSLDRAQALAELATSLAPDSANFLHTLAEIHRKKGDAQRAQELMTRAAAMDPRFQSRP